jgi:hypothetical protein
MSMKHFRVLSAVFVLILGVVFVSCDSENPPTDGSVLSATPDVITFAEADTSSATTLALSCGCAFTVEVIGDTNTIKPVGVENMGDLFAEHNIRFVDNDTNKLSEAKSFTYTIRATKKDYKYTKDVVVNVTP